MPAPAQFARRAGLPGSISAALVLAVVGGVAMTGPAAAQSPFAAMGGSWTGAGQVRFTNGQSESLKCRAYYTPKDGGSSLGLAIICASASSKIELRAQLAAESGRVTGSWEERTYNATGAVTGQASPSKISLSISGGGFNGSMNVGINGGSQTVTISTSGIGMTGVNISLSRS